MFRLVLLAPVPLLLRRGFGRPFHVDVLRRPYPLRLRLRDALRCQRIEVLLLVRIVRRLVSRGPLRLRGTHGAEQKTEDLPTLTHRIKRPTARSLRLRWTARISPVVCLCCTDWLYSANFPPLVASWKVLNVGHGVLFCRASLCISTQKFQRRADSTSPSIIWWNVFSGRSFNLYIFVVCILSPPSVSGSATLNYCSRSTHGKQDATKPLASDKLHVALSEGQRVASGSAGRLGRSSVVCL